MSKNDDYWSGAIYEKWIDPRTLELRETISNYVEQGSSVIDIGCGTGALVFELNEKCERVVGVDYSPKMIKHALKRKKEKDCSSVEFIEADATDLSQFSDQTFDYAIISLVLHGMPHALALSALQETKRIAKQVVW